MFELIEPISCLFMNNLRRPQVIGCEFFLVFGAAGHVAGCASVRSSRLEPGQASVIMDLQPIKRGPRLLAKPATGRAPCS